jgi:hypothetical protein
MSRARKLPYKWLGPYRVRKAVPDKGTYFLEEFDRTELASTYSSNRLKKFVQRNRFSMPVATNTDLDDDGSSDGSTDGSAGNMDNELHVLDNPTVCRSARIQRNTQMQESTVLLDAPRSGRFEIVSPSLTDEQRREYVRYKEDNEGNLI